jgi:hypothetical protein
LEVEGDVIVSECTSTHAPVRLLAATLLLSNFKKLLNWLWQCGSINIFLVLQQGAPHGGCREKFLPFKVVGRNEWEKVGDRIPRRFGHTSLTVPILRQIMNLAEAHNEIEGEEDGKTPPYRERRVFSHFLIEFIDTIIEEELGVVNVNDPERCPLYSTW